jgi:hypothetical protein
MKIHAVIPAVHGDQALEETLLSLANRLPEFAHAVIVCPQRAEHHVRAAATRACRETRLPVDVVLESGSGVYPAYNDGLLRLLADHARGYVLFLGAGDVLSAGLDVLQPALVDLPDVACFRVDGDPTALAPCPPVPHAPRRFARLPHHQGMLFHTRLGHRLLLPEQYPIYADVLQRVRVLATASSIAVSNACLVGVAPAGASGVRDLRSVSRHSAERLRLATTLLFGLRQPKLAARYTFGIGRVLRRWRSHVRTHAQHLPALS